MRSLFAAVVLCCLLPVAISAGAEEEARVRDSFAALDLSGTSAGQMAKQRTGSAQAADKTVFRLPPCVEREPSAAQLVRAAWEAAGLVAQEDRDRENRLAIGAWLPKVTAGVSMDEGDRWDYRYEPGEPRVDQLHQDDGLSWDVGLSWDLSRLAFQKEELQLARESASRAAMRRELATEVIRLAWSRQRILLKGMPPLGSGAWLQLEELTAVLDAWTADRFFTLWCGRNP